MPDSCMRKFSVGDRVVLRDDRHPEATYNGSLFVVMAYFGFGTYSCRMVSETIGGIYKGNEYTLEGGEMHMHCMFASTMTDQLDIGGKHGNS